MINLSGIMSPSNNMDRSWAIIGVTAVSAVAKGIGGVAKKRAAKKANAAAKVEMDKAMDQYRNMDTSNPYLNMENTMEDLTVNTQAADMANEQNQIGMSDTLGKMNQAAGGSGIAALAQAMANTSQIANQKASVSIATQEKANQSAERKEAAGIQDLERQGQIQSRNMKQKLAGMELSLASGDVQGTQQQMNTADDQIAGAVNDGMEVGGNYYANRK